MSDGSKDARQVGRDEMNLAEFPITLLTDHPSMGVKTLVFGGQYGKLTVSGSDDFGLPTALDADVIVGLIQLTKIKNNFADPKVNFTRYELLKLLGWPDQKQHYRRLDDSLRRWVGVTLRYDRSWWDNEVKCRVDANFHILDSVVLFDQEVRRTLRARHQPLPSSSFTWNKVFFKSCRAGNLKRLDLDTYFSLKSAVSKQTYRFLGKRFHVRSDWTFDLEEFAFEHVGLSRNYAPRKVKQKLQPALEELEGIGFLEPMANADRYARAAPGTWGIRLVRKRPAPASPEPGPEPSGLEHELVVRGITASAARELVATYAEGRIRAQLERFDWLRTKQPRKVTDPGGYLTDAIRRDYAAPAGFVSRAEREQAEQERRQREAEDRRAKARRQEDQARIDAYWQALALEQQARLEADAVEQADPAVRARCEAGTPRMRAMARRVIREAHIRSLLDPPVVG